MPIDGSPIEVTSPAIEMVRARLVAAQEALTLGELDHEVEGVPARNIDELWAELTAARSALCASLAEHVGLVTAVTCAEVAEISKWHP